ncbi:MAG: hypothetical protein KGY99_03110 [Phycisphaerae bacterium]|nr:hypothetical protein [Phycisphaerae bacterium]
MRQALYRVLASVILFALVGDSTGETPRPSVLEEDWQFEFKFKNLQPLRLKVGSEIKLYWYLRYTVMNRTGADRTFTPEFVLYSERGTLLKADEHVPPDAYRIIKKRHNNPLLRRNAAMNGKLLQGEDNAKHGVAIWPDFDAASGSVDIFIGGLSGENKQIVLPVPIRKTLRTAEGTTRESEKRTIVLSKTLNLRFEIPGEAAARHRVTPKLTAAKWVMR